VDFIKSNFCGDAWVTSIEGRQVVQVAQFGSEADAQSFADFLAQQGISDVFYPVEEESYKDANYSGNLETCIQDVMTWQNQEWTYDSAWTFCMTPLSEIQAE